MLGEPRLATSADRLGSLAKLGFSARPLSDGGALDVDLPLELVRASTLKARERRAFGFERGLPGARLLDCRIDCGTPFVDADLLGADSAIAG